MQRVLFLTRRGLAATATDAPRARLGPLAGTRRGLASSSSAASSDDDGGINAPASFSPEKMEKGA